MFLSLSHPPGHAQVEFGEARGVIGGVQHKIHFLTMDLLIGQSQVNVLLTYQLVLCWYTTMNEPLLGRDAAYEMIVNLIIGGTLAPNQPLSECTLADLVGMGRMPVREAIKDLAGDGLLEVIPLRGTFIREHGLAIHMDGTRLFNAEFGPGVQAVDYAAIADTVFIDLTKGLGCRFEALLLAGPRDMLKEVWWHKLRLDGACARRASWSQQAFMLLRIISQGWMKIISTHACMVHPKTNAAAGFGDTCRNQYRCLAL